MEMMETNCSSCFKSLNTLELIHGFELDSLLKEVKVSQLSNLKPDQKDVSESSILTKSSEGGSPDQGK